MFLCSKMEDKNEGFYSMYDYNLLFSWYIKLLISWKLNRKNKCFLKLFKDQVVYCYGSLDPIDCVKHAFNSLMDKCIKFHET